MSNTMSIFLNDLSPFTDWYESSWLIHKLRMIKNQDLYNKQLRVYYEKNSFRDGDVGFYGLFRI